MKIKTKHGIIPIHIKTINGKITELYIEEKNMLTLSYTWFLVEVRTRQEKDAMQKLYQLLDNSEKEEYLEDWAQYLQNCPKIREIRYEAGKVFFDPKSFVLVLGKYFNRDIAQSGQSTRFGSEMP